MADKYVDPAINANSGTGTAGDPFGDLQYALNNTTRNTTTGDRFLIKSGTAEVLAAALSLATYGTPTQAAPLIFEGYTTTAGDGGIADINGNALYSVIAAGFGAYGITFKNLKLRNTGANVIVSCNTSNGSMVLDTCELYDSTVGGMTGRGHVRNCYFHDIGGYGVNGLNIIARRNVFKNGSVRRFGTTTAAITSAAAFQNIIILDSTSVGIYYQGITSGMPGIIWGNIVYSNAGTGKGIHAHFNSDSSVADNVLMGFSGSGGVGLEGSGTFSRAHLFTRNAFYNNTTQYNAVFDTSLYAANNLTLTQDPFTDAANGDFSLNTYGQAQLAGLAMALNGLSATALFQSIGVGHPALSSGSPNSIFDAGVFE